MAAQTPSTTIQRSDAPGDAIPEIERFVPSDDLRVSIHLSPNTVRIGETPTITVRFCNAGREALYLNPWQAWMAHVVDRRPPLSCTSDADVFPRSITVKDLVRLEPSQTWETRVLPGPAARSPSGIPTGFALSRGVHEIGFRYTNYPDCQSNRYDPYEINVRVWEGQIDAPPATLNVIALDEKMERMLIDRLDRGVIDDAELTVLALQDTSTALDALLKHVGTSSDIGHRVLGVMRQNPSPDLVPRLLAQIATNDPRIERIDWTRLALLLRDRHDCRIWPFISRQLDTSRGILAHEFGETVARHAPRCPEIGSELRAIVKDAAAPMRNRIQATALLAGLHDATDVPLLAALLGEPAGSDRAGNGFRSALADALGKIGGERAVTALIDAMGDSKTNGAILSAVARALRTAGDRRSLPALVSRLGSADHDVIVQILIGLRELDARAATPHVIPLLEHPSSTIRTYAVLALEETLDDGVVRAMRAAARDAAASLVARALFYLGKHDPASLPLFEQSARSPQQDVREAANAGIRRFGTAATVKAIRPLLDSRNPSVRSYVSHTLEALTFRSWWPPNRPSRVNTSALDEWLAQNGIRSRIDWAIEALDRPVRNTPGWTLNEKVQALTYLDAQPGMARATFERMLQDPDPAVRQRAAQAIARFDRLRAAQLLIREFDSRFLQACVRANANLHQLTGRELKFDFERPGARAEAKARWTAMVTSLK